MSTNPLPLPFLDHFANEKDLLVHAGRLLDTLDRNNITDARNADICLQVCSITNQAVRTGGVHPDDLMSPAAMRILGDQLVANKGPDGQFNHEAVEAVIIIARAVIAQRDFVVRSMAAKRQQAQ